MSDKPMTFEPLCVTCGNVMQSTACYEAHAPDPLSPEKFARKYDVSPKSYIAEDYAYCHRRYTAKCGEAERLSELLARHMKTNTLYSDYCQLKEKNEKLQAKVNELRLDLAFIKTQKVIPKLPD